MNTAKIQHPTLGQVIGLKEGTVHRFLGIKYGRLSHGFADPELYEYSALDVIDARKKGPTAMQPPNTCVGEHRVIQHSLPIDDLGMSTTECLNLNIFAPEKHSATPYPVLVFIHGGAFSLGSGSWPQYDMTRFVALSVQTGQPVVAITINYRLGVYGFLSSAELQKAGIPGNRGLLDQRVAFAWIARHIRGFGGDPSNITASGESAGGASCTYHLHVKEPQFRQLISLSGNCIFLKPLPPPVFEFAYETVLKALSLEDSGEDRINKLILTHSDVFAKLPHTIPLLPTLDEQSSVLDISIADCLSGTLAKTLPGWTWCERLLVGDCQFDGSIFALSFQNGPAGIAEKFTSIMQESLRDYPDAAKAILSSYQIDSTNDEQEGVVRVLRYLTDACFYNTTLALADSWIGRSFVYHFNLPNPWDGPFKGEATHVLDVAVVFQNYNDFLNDEERAVAVNMGNDFVSFLYRKQSPFPTYSRERGGAKVYHSEKAGGGEFLLSTDPESYKRSRFIRELALSVPQDILLNVGSEFLASP